MPLTRAERIEQARSRARELALRLGHPSRDIGSAERGGREAPERSDETTCRAMLAALAKAGLLGYVVPSPYGGVSPAVEVGPIAAIREELAYGSGLLDLLFVMQGLGSYAITLAGTDEQKRRWLPRVAAGEAVAAFAVTEPGAGSDVGAIATTARREGDALVVNGEKWFISNAPFADLFTVIARTGPGEGRKGLGALVLERGAKGLTVEAIEVNAAHPIGAVRFDGCRAPASSALGSAGEGFTIALATLDRFRPTVGGAAVGFGRRALDEAVRFAQSRVQFGRPIGEFEGIQFKLAEMATSLDAARLLVERAADSADRAAGAAGEGGSAGAGTADGESVVGGISAGNRGAGSVPVSYPISPLGEAPAREASMAKLFATEAAQMIVDESVQIHGGRGLVRGHIVEVLYREVRALRIYEGTSEIQRTVIARSLLA